MFLAPDAEPEELSMAWKTPKIVEIAAGMEINSYACAELA
ncbi:pyrroloquinoline quinone precursor peptide PqqA [Muricoccus radiodurans]